MTRPAAVSTSDLGGDADVGGLDDGAGERVLVALGRAEADLLRPDPDGDPVAAAVEQVGRHAHDVARVERAPRRARLRLPCSRFETPRNPATNAVRGRSYSSVGEPSCSILPRFITAIVSAIVIASS